jgi:hypothetical protein
MEQNHGRMDLMQALLHALKRAAGSDVECIRQTSPDGILLTHVCGARLIVRPSALAAHVAGDPERVEAEAEGALAALAAMGSQAHESKKTDILALLVPVVRPASWIAAAQRHTGLDMIDTGLAFPLGRALFVTFAIEHVDRRVPMLDGSVLHGVSHRALLDGALANQRRMANAHAGDLLATDLHMGDGTFFLRSKNLQAASLILQPFAWRLIERFAPTPPKAVLGAVVGPDAILFGPADPDDPETYADLLRSALRGLRKSFGAEDDWGDDVFLPQDGSGLPRRVA